MNALKILLLEDSPLDAELIQAVLADGEIECELLRVDTRTEFITALENQPFDLILSDYSLPTFDGISALDVARVTRPDLPFIFVSATLGEEVAIDMLKSGATDYVLKQRLNRLVPSVRRALRETQARLERQSTEAELYERTVQLAAINQELENEIAERRRAEAELARSLEREQVARTAAEQANRIKDEFLAILSHELRTPLNPILGWAGLLRTRKLDEVKTTIALETIERNARLQAQLVDDLLDLSRILQGKLSLNIQPVDLVTTIAAAIKTIELAAITKSISLTVTVLQPGSDGEQPAENKSVASTTASANQDSLSEPGNAMPSSFVVLGDADRLQQIIWNLVSNAVKFTPDGGKIELCLERVNPGQATVPTGTHQLPASKATTRRFAQIIIRDTGKGISPTFLPYVFDYFRQADSTTTRVAGGLGLGLAIVRYLVELHGGTIWAESPGEGEGATFTVRLPLMQEPQRW